VSPSRAQVIAELRAATACQTTRSWVEVVQEVAALILQPTPATEAQVPDQEVEVAQEAELMLRSLRVAAQVVVEVQVELLS
jgi:hypothetical protein